MNVNPEIVESIKVVTDIQIENRALMRCPEYDGYEVKTNQHCYMVLIENEQNCCETWGYFASNDNDLGQYVGKVLAGVYLTDTALNTKKVEELHLDERDIQFVDFVFADGDKLQLAVYNAHNGYYGHSILVIRDDVILKQDTL
ncbi:MAG: hypothetical protein IKK34_07015 [Clostridia bacterium]|nr:hypothetical protein [Clostridia bacterium]